MIALVTYSDEPGLTVYDSLLGRALTAAHIDWETHPWDDPGVDWNSYDAVIIRSTWDYYVKPAEFSAWIDARAANGDRVWNPPSVLQWNSHKRYLRTLESAGFNVVPTEWVTGTTSLANLMQARGWDRAVAKLAVSAGAYRTKIVSGSAEDQEFLDGLVKDGEVMIQPFLAEIVNEGEWSVVFFDGTFSHAVLKKPADGDFRVQARHGGSTIQSEPPAGMIEQAERIMQMAPEPTLYARVDGIHTGEGFMLLELEVLEPVLFFDEAPGSVERFVAAIASRL